MIKLSILIPTYNRANNLIENLSHLEKIITSNNIESIVNIIISNNLSTDNTEEVVNKFIKNHSSLNIKYYKQDKNIGLEKNALFTLFKADGEYVMYNGDDDYIHTDYLNEFISTTNENKKIRAIIPSIIPIDKEGNKLSGGRDQGLPQKSYSAGFKNCLLNSWRGHQLSGLIFKRKGLHDSYVENNVSNIYPFIYLTSYSCLIGDCLHATNLPVKVTAVDQSKKDWNYGSDGLLNDVFDNYQKLSVNEFQKSILQLYFIHKQTWRLTNFRYEGPRKLLKVVGRIWFSDKTNIYFKILFPIIFLLTILHNRFK